MMLAHVRHSLATRFRRIRLYHQTVSELSALHDRDLADLGIARGDIREVARRTMI